MNNDIYAAEPSDVYVDRNGKLWRVVGCWEGEKVVIVEEIEKAGDGNYDEKVRMTASVGGLNFEGFKRVLSYRELMSRK